MDLALGSSLVKPIKTRRLTQTRPINMSKQMCIHQYNYFTINIHNFKWHRLDNSSFYSSWANETNDLYIHPYVLVFKRASNSIQNKALLSTNEMPKPCQRDRGILGICFCWLKYGKGWSKRASHQWLAGAKSVVTVNSGVYLLFGQVHVKSISQNNWGASVKDNPETEE